MPAHLIGPPPASTPTSLDSARGQPRALPDDILREASLRLGILSLVVAALWFLGTVLGHLATRSLAPPGEPTWRMFGPRDVISTASITLSLALFAYTRRSTRGPQFVLDLGLAYMIVMALALGVMFHWYGVSAMRPTNPELSWIGVMLLMFAAVLPSSTPKVLVSGAVAVVMNPVGMLIAPTHGGRELEHAWDALLMHYPDFLLVGVAVVISRVVTQLGRQVGRAREMGSYRLGELLGRGGMGEVYKATHRMLARPAAIKLIRPEALGAGGGEAARIAAKRFHREAEAAANLRSPHTVEIYDFGVTDDGTLYFVMELLDGLDLESLVERHGPIPAARVIHILCQACESLEEAHRAGLVHRDIKPANIHVGKLGLHRDFVKVLDFGLVKPFAGENQLQSLGTMAGQTPGTPSYMAPELSLGEAVDGRADIYALGCVAYFLLTGHRVFEAESAFQVVVQHLQSVPREPSLRTDNFIPRPLELLVLRCLAKDVADRPQSAADLARELAAIDVLSWGEEEAAHWWSVHQPASQPAPDSPERSDATTRSTSSARVTARS